MPRNDQATDAVAGDLRRISARVERQYHSPPRQHRAQRTQRKQAAAQQATDVDVNDIGRYLAEQRQYLPAALRVVDVVGVATPMARQVDDWSRHATRPQVITNGDQVRLNPAVWRRVRAELQDDHQSLRASAASRSTATGVSPAADSSSARQPMVAREPSRAVHRRGAAASYRRHERRDQLRVAFVRPPVRACVPGRRSDVDPRKVLSRRRRRRRQRPQRARLPMSCCLPYSR